MAELQDQGKLMTKLAAPLATVVDKHKDLILGKLGGSATLLANDDKVREVARFCYPALPFPARMLLKEDAFVDFVLKHRETVFRQLAATAAAA
jgi:hypothetical protein